MLLIVGLIFFITFKQADIEIESTKATSMEDVSIGVLEK